MRIAIGAVGRMKAGPERELVARYLDRAVASGRPLGLTAFEVMELTESRAGTSAARKADEAKALSAALPEGLVVALDERGKTLGSEAFAALIGRWRDDGRPAVSFVIGGADGLDPAFVRSAETTLSFSPLTWPHQLVRIMLAEQLYRVTTILSGHPYHRGGLRGPTDFVHPEGQARNPEIAYYPMCQSGHPPPCGEGKRSLAKGLAKLGRGDRSPNIVAHPPPPFPSAQGGGDWSGEYLC